MRSEMGGISACGGAKHAFRKIFALKISALILAFTSEAVFETKLFLFISFFKKSELFVTKQMEQSIVKMIQGHSCLHINFKI